MLGRYERRGLQTPIATELSILACTFDGLSVVSFLSATSSEPIVTLHSGSGATNQTSTQEVVRMNVSTANTSSRSVVIQLPLEGDTV
jgi:hypothetical protein